MIECWESTTTRPHVYLQVSVLLTRFIATPSFTLHYQNLTTLHVVFNHHSFTRVLHCRGFFRPFRVEMSFSDLKLILPAGL